MAELHISENDGKVEMTPAFQKPETIGTVESTPGTVTDVHIETGNTAAIVPEHSTSR